MNGQTIARTPASIELPRTAPSTVEVALAGHGAQQCDASMSAGGGYVVGDAFLCLTVIGCIAFLDAGGAWNRLNHPACNVTFAPDRMPQKAP